MHKIRLLTPSIMAFIALTIALASLRLGLKPTYAQSPDDIRVVKVLNQPSPVVRVGQFISFTIYITNESTITLTHASLFDDYREDILGSFGMLGGDPGPTVINTAAGTMTWTNLISNPAAAGYFPELPPGQGISLTMQFQIEHPPTVPGGLTIVNQAQIRDAVFAGGGGGDGSVISAPTVPITGGNATIVKNLSPPDQSPVVGERLTYTIQLTNEGAIAITEAVVADVYNPAYLAFVTSTPTLPTFIDTQNGVISWTNLASPSLQPGQGISITVVFEVLQGGIQALNRAELVSARDFFGNDLAPGSGEVGIIIVDDSTGDTTTKDDGNENDDDDDDDDITAPSGSSAPAVPAATATPAAQGVTGPNAPTQLPETGRIDPNRPVFGPVLTLLVLLTAAWYFFRMRKINRKD
ncbi:MAG TPA: hypothetical protein VGD99_21520 [Anaerolineae bacterium]